MTDICLSVVFYVYDPVDVGRFEFSPRQGVAAKLANCSGHDDYAGAIIRVDMIRTIWSHSSVIRMPIRQNGQRRKDTSLTLSLRFMCCPDPVF